MPVILSLQPPTPSVVIVSSMFSDCYFRPNSWRIKHMTQGKVRALVSREPWERVQAILDGRTSNKSRQSKHEFTLTGLVHCGHCGCLMVGEVKKRRYVYYHYSGSKSKCGDPYVREEQMLREVSQAAEAAGDRAANDVVA